MSMSRPFTRWLNRLLRRKPSFLEQHPSYFANTRRIGVHKC